MNMTADAIERPTTRAEPMTLDTRSEFASARRKVLKRTLDCLSIGPRISVSSFSAWITETGGSLPGLGSPSESVRIQLFVTVLLAEQHQWNHLAHCAVAR